MSTTFYSFLKQVDPSLANEYQLERFKDEHISHINQPESSVPDFRDEPPIFKKSLQLPTIESLSEDHFAKKYVQGRKIPRYYQSYLYYSEDFQEFVKKLGIEKDLSPNDKRLVIPIYDKENNLIAFQGRALGDSAIRYITIKFDDDSKKVFGLERIDPSRTIYVVEGPIDSMFIDNAVATCDSHLESAADSLDKSNLVLIFDNQPRNKEIIQQIDHAIDNHFNVVIWPEMIEEKDINEMVINGFSSDEIQDIIDSNTFQNLSAKMQFLNWKKV